MKNSAVKYNRYSYHKSISKFQHFVLADIRVESELNLHVPRIANLSFHCFAEISKMTCKHDANRMDLK